MMHILNAHVALYHEKIGVSDLITEEKTIIIISLTIKVYQNIKTLLGVKTENNKLVVLDI